MTINVSLDKSAYFKPATQIVDRAIYHSPLAESAKDDLDNTLEDMNIRWLGQLLAVSKHAMLYAHQNAGREWNDTLANTVFRSLRDGFILSDKFQEAQAALGFSDKKFPAGKDQAKELLSRFLAHAPRPVWNPALVKALEGRFNAEVVKQLLQAAKTEILQQELEASFEAAYVTEHGIAPEKKNRYISELDVGPGIVETLAARFANVTAQTISMIDNVAREEVRRAIRDVNERPFNF